MCGESRPRQAKSSHRYKILDTRQAMCHNVICSHISRAACRELGVPTSHVVKADIHRQRALTRGPSAQDTASENGWYDQKQGCAWGTTCAWCLVSTIHTHVVKADTRTEGSHTHGVLVFAYCWASVVLWVYWVFEGWIQWKFPQLTAGYNLCTFQWKTGKTADEDEW